MCTGITLTTKDGGTVRGRTLEFGIPMQSNLIVFPRGVAVSATGPDGKPGSGMTWTVKYGAAGMNGAGQEAIVDGVNEKGLSAGIFYFPNYAGYMDVSPADAAKSVAPWDVLTWALTQFATVAEVKAALPRLLVNSATLGAWGILPTVHYYLADNVGGRLVVEYLGGELHLHDAPLGICTNAPDYGWHMTNLGNYVALDPNPTKVVTVEDVKVAAPSTGGNTLGLPGDYSSPSRFVRAAFFTALLPEQATTQEAVMTGFHLLDSFDIPLGSVPEAPGSTPPFETTEWTCMADMSHPAYHVWTYENREIRRVVLDDALLSGNAVMQFALDQKQGFVDLRP